MGASLSAKVTLHGGVKHTVKAEDELVIAEDCYDISDKALLASRIKHLDKGKRVTVKDIYRTADGTFEAVRVWYEKKLYWISSTYLTI